MQSLLEKRYQAKCAVLTNGQATRENIIDGFRSHLSQAKSGDSAVFYYAGHGSQVAAGGQFAEIESSDKLQSLVCIDSRKPGGYDLVDKDIATLIAELADQGAHVTVILDSCHSGSGTRDSRDRGGPRPPRIRRADDRKDVPPPEVFVRLRNVSDAEALSITLSAVKGFKPDTSGRHVLLAACEDFESSQELAGERHGLFTWCLLQVLQGSDEGMSYEEIYQRVLSLQQQKIAADPAFQPQKPQLEALHGDHNRMSLFLRMTPLARSEFFMARWTGSQWLLDGGTLNRLSAGDALALYAASASAEEMRNAAQVEATATAAVTDPAESTLRVEGTALDPALQYKAVVTHRAACVSIGLEGDSRGLSLMRAALAYAPSVREGLPSRFTVSCEGGQIALRADSGRRTPGPFPASPGGAAQAAAVLEHMAKWTMRLELSNPLSKIGPEQVQFTVIMPNGQEVDCPPVTHLELECVRDASGAWQQPSFRVKIANHTPTRFSIALLAFSENWSVFTGLIAGGTKLLEANIPGQSYQPFYPYSGQPIAITIAPDATESSDDLLLIVSSDAFNADELALEPVAPEVQTRDFAAATVPAVPAWLHDFATRQLHIRTVRKDA
jgi:hypothetical protein